MVGKVKGKRARGHQRYKWADSIKIWSGYRLVECTMKSQNKKLWKFLIINLHCGDDSRSWKLWNDVMMAVMMMAMMMIVIKMKAIWKNQIPGHSSQVHFFLFISLLVTAWNAFWDSGVNVYFVSFSLEKCLASMLRWAIVFLNWHTASFIHMFVCEVSIRCKNVLMAWLVTCEIFDCRKIINRSWMTSGRLKKVGTLKKKKIKMVFGNTSLEKLWVTSILNWKKTDSIGNIRLAKLQVNSIIKFKM